MQIASRTSSRPRLGVEMRSKLDSLSSSLSLDLTMDRLSESRRKRGRPEVRGDGGCTRNLSDVISGEYNGACKTLIRSKSSNHAACQPITLSYTIVTQRVCHWQCNTTAISSKNTKGPHHFTLSNPSLTNLPFFFSSSPHSSFSGIYL
jgi:hypothetical protein